MTGGRGAGTPFLPVSQESRPCRTPRPTRCSFACTMKTPTFPAASITPPICASSSAGAPSGCARAGSGTASWRSLRRRLRGALVQIEYLAAALMDDLLREFETSVSARPAEPRSSSGSGSCAATTNWSRPRCWPRPFATAVRCGLRLPCTVFLTAFLIDGTRASRIELFPFDQAVDTMSTANY